MLDKQLKTTTGSKQSWIVGRRGSIQLYHIQLKNPNPNLMFLGYQALWLGLGLGNYFLRSPYTMWYYVCVALLLFARIDTVANKGVCSAEGE
eukprot:COSAG05_NODE_3664_length_1919_cov_13.108523_2_plen_92_part_00